MSTTAIGARKLLLTVSIVALGVMLNPTLNAQAQAASEPGTPPAPEQRRGLRLERVWARQQRLHDRLSFMFDHAQQRINGAQELIDRAEANGKDISALQAALDAFAEGLKDARPIFESGKGIIAAHQGFDASGNATDLELAAKTVEEMAGKLKEIRGILLDPARALGEAIRSFREANKPN
jgi:hypothetical protein